MSDPSVVALEEDTPVDIPLPEDRLVMVRVPPLVGDKGGEASRTIKVTSLGAYQDFTEKGRFENSHFVVLVLDRFEASPVRVTLSPPDRIWVK